MEMYEEAVRDLDHVYQQDKSRENKRLLEAAKVTLPVHIIYLYFLCPYVGFMITILIGEGVVQLSVEVDVTPQSQHY